MEGEIGGAAEITDYFNFFILLNSMVIANYLVFFFDFFSCGKRDNSDHLVDFNDMVIRTIILFLSAELDWTAIKGPYWGGLENLLLKRKKQAEFLMQDDLSSNLIFGFGCYYDDAKNKLVSMGISENKIKVIPKAYY